jgi:CheY-like chemotaxis protein
VANGDPVVAVINTSQDVVDMLRIALQEAGIIAMTMLTHEIRDGERDLGAFVAEHRPRAIIYDIAPPYEANWRLFQHLLATRSMADIPIVLTTTNVHHVEQLAGSERRVYEIVGKPYDLDQIVRATREALRARPTR